MMGNRNDGQRAAELVIHASEFESTECDGDDDDGDERPYFPVLLLLLDRFSSTYHSRSQARHWRPP